MRNRIDEIKAKGFNIMQGSPDTDYRDNVTGYQPAIDYSKIKVGAKTLEDAVLDFGVYKKNKSKMCR